MNIHTTRLAPSQTKQVLMPPVVEWQTNHIKINYVFNIRKFEKCILIFHINVFEFKIGISQTWKLTYNVNDMLNTYHQLP